MKRRKGSILSISLIVMLLLIMLSASVFGLAYINRKSAEQQMALFQTRALANSVLFSIGLVLSDDLGSSDPWITQSILESGQVGSFIDSPFNVNVSLFATSSDKTITIKCSASFNEWNGEELTLHLSPQGGGYKWVW